MRPDSEGGINIENGALTVDLGDLGSFQGEVVHQPFIVEDDSDDGIVEVVAVNIHSLSPFNHGDGSVYPDFPTARRTEGFQGWPFQAD